MTGSRRSFDLKEKLKYVLHTHYSKNKLRPRKVGILDLSVDINLNTLKAEVKSFRYLKDPTTPEHRWEVKGQNKQLIINLFFIINRFKDKYPTK